MYEQMHYGSLNEMVSVVKRLPYKSDPYDDPKFYGGSWEDVYRYAEKGWAEGAVEASRVATSIANRTIQGTATALVPEVVYDVVGAAYDPGAYMSGVPECWMGFEPREERRAVRIAVNIAVSEGVKLDTFRRRGYALAALAMALNAQGHPVSVDVLQCLKHEYGGKITTMTLQSLPVPGFVSVSCPQGFEGGTARGS